MAKRVDPFSIRGPFLFSISPVMVAACDALPVFTSARTQSKSCAGYLVAISGSLLTPSTISENTFSAWAYLPSATKVEARVLRAYAMEVEAG